MSAGAPCSDKSLVIFGRDITKIPCFRNSMLYGIYGGIAGGLLRFMFTSKPKSAADFAMGSFIAVTMGYWVKCRYEYSKIKREMDQLQFLMQQHSIYEGSVEEQKIEERNTRNVPRES